MDGQDDSQGDWNAAEALAEELLPGWLSDEDDDDDPAAPVRPSWRGEMPSDRPAARP